MASATIVPGSVVKDSTTLYVSATVDEGGSTGRVEYRASTPLSDPDGNAYSGPQLKINAIAALKAVRDAQMGTSQAVGGITGAVTL